MIDHSYSKYSSLYGSGGSRGGARDSGPPLFLDQTEAQRAEKNLFGDLDPDRVIIRDTVRSDDVKVLKSR